MADERRQTELRRKVDKLRHTRHLYETLQAKNYEQYRIPFDTSILTSNYVFLDNYLICKNVDTN